MKQALSIIIPASSLIQAEFLFLTLKWSVPSTCVLLDLFFNTCGHKVGKRLKKNKTALRIHTKCADIPQNLKWCAQKKIRFINHAFVHLQEISHSYITVHLEMFACWSASYSTFDKPIFNPYWSMQSTSWMFNINGMRFAARSTIKGKAVSGNMLLQLTVKRQNWSDPKTTYAVTPVFIAVARSAWCFLCISSQLFLLMPLILWFQRFNI